MREFTVGLSLLVAVVLAVVSWQLKRDVSELKAQNNNATNSQATTDVEPTSVAVTIGNTTVQQVDPTPARLATLQQEVSSLQQAIERLNGRLDELENTFFNESFPTNSSLTSDNVSSDDVDSAENDVIQRTQVAHVENAYLGEAIDSVWSSDMQLLAEETFAQGITIAAQGQPTASLTAFTCRERTCEFHLQADSLSTTLAAQEKLGVFLTRHFSRLIWDIPQRFGQNYSVRGFASKS